MAVTKILARKGRLDVGINYVLNVDKTEDRVLTAHLNCGVVKKRVVGKHASSGTESANFGGYAAGRRAASL